MKAMVTDELTTRKHMKLKCKSKCKSLATISMIMSCMHSFEASAGGLELGPPVPHLDVITTSPIGLTLKPEYLLAHIYK